MLLFWCIKFNGAKTLFLVVQVCLLVSRTSGGLLDQFVMFWSCRHVFHTCAFRMSIMQGKDTLHSNGGSPRLDAVHATA
jgi:hypothetical protein